MSTTTVSTNKTVIGSASEATTSIFDMVSNTAGQTSKLISSVGVSIDMFDTFVTDARKRQIARSKIHMNQFYKELAEDTAKNIAYRQREIQKELQGDAEFAKLYETSYLELKSILDEIQD